MSLSACLRGHIPETLLSDKYDDARRLAHQYGDIFGKKNFFLEVQDHHLEQDKRLTPQLLRLSAARPHVSSSSANKLTPLLGGHRQRDKALSESIPPAYI